MSHLIDAAVLCHPGTERDHNEDHGAVLREGDGAVLLAVADGVSNAAGGDTASRLAVEELVRSYREDHIALAPGKRLQRAVQRANIAVHDLALLVPELRGMATTLTALVATAGDLTAVHVGDCRLYRLRSGALTQLSKDHTVAGERVRFRLLSEERARLHPGRSILTRSLGRDLIVSVDRIGTRLAPGDVLLCCSDGLYNVLGSEEIAALAGAGTAESAARTLVEEANRRGTPDNVTAGIVRVMARPPGVRTG